jgi:hypothetical protein
LHGRAISTRALRTQPPGIAVMPVAASREQAERLSNARLTAARSLRGTRAIGRGSA